MPYKGKKLIVARRPWWRHPIFPWGWYSLVMDSFDVSQPLIVDGYHAVGDGGGGAYRYEAPNEPEHGEG